MKTPSRLQIILTSLAVLTVVAIGSGCVVESVYPFYTTKDVVFQPELLGKWSDPAKTNAATEYWEFRRGDHNTYQFTTVDGSETNGYEAHLFHLQQHLFLDARSTNEVSQQLAVHYLLKVQLTPPTVSFQLLDQKWLAELLERDPKALRHLPNSDTNSDRLVLTADTQELQAFLRAHANNTNAFAESIKMKQQ